MTRHSATPSRPARSGRRATILAVYALYPTLVVAVLGTEGLWANVPSLPALAFALAAWAGVAVFMRMGRFWLLGNAPDDQLDEREVQVRLRAYSWSYVTLVSLVFVALVLWTVGVDLIDPVSLSYPQLSAIGWGFFLYGLTLPTAVIAWTEREDCE